MGNILELLLIIARSESHGWAGVNSSDEMFQISELLFEIQTNSQGGELLAKQKPAQNI